MCDAQTVDCIGVWDWVPQHQWAPTFEGLIYDLAVWVPSSIPVS